MTNYGQTSKDIQDEYEKDEEPLEQEYIRTFPKKFSSSLPRVRLGMKVPDSMEYMGGWDSIRMTVPKSDIFNKEWRNFDTRLFGKKKI